MKGLLVSHKHLVLIASLLLFGWTPLWAGQPASDRDQEQITSTQSLSQFGITWTFSQPVTFGQFANGDYWVVGPVTIRDIDPPSQNVAGRIIKVIGNRFLRTT